ncbi:hypothetical protein EDC30_10621 [Paucimonas lemoignei]|uniref:Tfp pilus assembly protein PilX n=1 Tax=Paucimonas lemoignei TaxID=29443 RepID=A0A4R3HTS3_PAULE|nr:hypothetical protein [Paucimonas lemoignei]TCS36482.1 hypothetical protein EDC30_10621 [Paucimonas lemoignei]
MNRFHIDQKKPFTSSIITSRFDRVSGIALPIVLIALLLMSIAAVGMLRMVDTSTLVIGNLAFKQGTTSVADRATETAITFLNQKEVAAQTGDVYLYTSNVNAGYFAANVPELDITGKSTDSSRKLVDWNNDNCAYAESGSYSSCQKSFAVTDPASGYKASYIIMRLCKGEAKPGGTLADGTANTCVTPVQGGSTDMVKRSECDYADPTRCLPPGAGKAAVAKRPFYRILVRSTGPRNTVSYTESYVHF